MIPSHHEDFVFRLTNKEKNWVRETWMKMDKDFEITLNRYLIETPHTAQDCKALVDQIIAMGFLNHFEWGCLAGIHSGWAIIEAENEDQARLAVPSFVRRKARIVKLNRFEENEPKTHAVGV